MNYVHCQNSAPMQEVVGSLCWEAKSQVSACFLHMHPPATCNNIIAIWVRIQVHVDAWLEIGCATHWAHHFFHYSLTKHTNTKESHHTETKEMRKVLSPSQWTFLCGSSRIVHSVTVLGSLAQQSVQINSCIECAHGHRRDEVWMGTKGMLRF